MVQQNSAAKQHRVKKRILALFFLFFRIIAIRNCAKERFIFIPKPVMGFSLLTFIAELNPGLQLTQHILYVPHRTRESWSRTRVSFDSTGFWSHYNILRPATLLNQVSQEKDWPISPAPEAKALLFWEHASCWISKITQERFPHSKLWDTRKFSTLKLALYCTILFFSPLDVAAVETKNHGVKELEQPKRDEDKVLTVFLKSQLDSVKKQARQKLLANTLTNHSGNRSRILAV